MLAARILECHFLCPIIRSQSLGDIVGVYVFNFAELSSLHISSIGNESVDCSEDRNIPQQTVFFGNQNHGYQQNAVDEQMDEQQEPEQQQQQAFDNMLLDENVPRVWKIGDKCLAPWSDGEVCVLCCSLFVILIARVWKRSMNLI